MLDIAPKDVHLHIKRYPINQIPVHDETQLREWLHKCWKEKDELLDYFEANKRFPALKDNQPPSATASMLQPSPFLYGWFVWWLVLIACGLWSLSNNMLYLAIVIIGNGIHWVTTFSPAVRVYRGLLPPLGYEASLRESSAKGSEERGRERDEMQTTMKGKEAKLKMN